MESPLVSVIICNYNNQQYLPECLDSVVNQTYKKLEIIIVNDGSTDGSMNVINDYINSDRRIKCIDQKNTGVAIARKHGLDMATGKWVQYLDSDDFLELDSVERLVARAEDACADIVTSPFYFYCYDGRKRVSFVPDYDRIGGKDFLKLVLGNGNGAWSMWANFQKRSLAYDFDIDVVPIRVGEDAVYMSQILLNDPIVVSEQQPVVNYRQNPKSVMNSDEYRRGRTEDLRFLRDYLVELIDRKSLTEEFTVAVAHLKLNTFSYCLDGHFTDFTKQEIKEVRAAYGVAPSGFPKRKVYKLMRAFSVNRLLWKLYYKYYLLKKKY